MDATTRNPEHGWVLYDGECGFCQRLVTRHGSFLAAHGYRLAHLQESWVGERLGLVDEELRRELKLLRADGRVLGGADAVLAIAQRAWWLWPFATLARLPGAIHIARAVYRRIAARRHCIGGACAVPARSDPPQKSAEASTDAAKNDPLRP